jgi:hypothetical protein
VLGWEPERRRGLQWWESVRWVCRRWKRRGARARAWTRNRVESSAGGFSKSVGTRGRTREMGQGVGLVPRGARETGERERGPRAWRSVPQGEGRGRQRLPAIGRGRRRCWANRGERRVRATWRCATDRWGLVVNSGLQEEERRARQRGSGAPTGRPSQHSAGRHGLNGFNDIH